MAEKIKRRVAAARLAVAFVAAGSIAGATWAEAGPQPPQAESSASDIFLKHKIDSGDIKNGSLLFQDFKSGQVLSNDVFVKYKKAIADFKLDVKGDTAAIKGELGAFKLEIDGIISGAAAVKAELGSFVKLSDADARYLKVTDDVMRGDGSVLTASALVGGQKVQLANAVGMFTVDATGPTITITNTSGSPLSHTNCGGQDPAGILEPGNSISCPADDISATVQLIGTGANPHVATLSFSGITVPTGPGSPGGTQITTQILIGL